MFITGSSDILPLPPAVGRNDVNKTEASKQSFQSDPAVREDAGVRYFSPVVRIDPESQQAIIIFREADGEIKKQYPSEKELKAYRSNRLAASENTMAARPAEDKGTDTEQPAVRTTGSDARTNTVPEKPAVTLPDTGGGTGDTETSDNNGGVIV